MLQEGLSPDAVTFACILKACTSIGAADEGEKVHAEIVKQGLLEKDIVLGNALVDMYAKCGAVAKAQKVLDELPNRNVVSWSSLIAAYVQHGHAEEALNSFYRMQHEGVSPDAVTFICTLKACGIVGAFDKGEKVHTNIVKQGLLAKSIVLGNALLDMYAKCGALAKAQQVLDELPIKDVGSWNALIAGYVSHRHYEEALNCFEQMQYEGLSPNAITFTCILKVCGQVGAVDKGKKVHTEIVRQGLLKKSFVLGNALVDMYAKCGSLAKAEEVLYGLPVRSVVPWSALIAGYAQHGPSEYALNCFDRMQSECISPDALTFTSILKVCGSIGAIDKGEIIHAEIARQGLLETNAALANALVDMYTKCGLLVKAQQVLHEIFLWDVGSWNALMAGYAQHGHGEEAANSFEQMQYMGVTPDAATFACVLNACSHSGLLGEGETYFCTMSSKYGIIPDLEHHTSMVDLFARAGHFDKAVEMIKKMPYSDCLPVWDTLLGACHKWGNVKLGKFAFEHAVQLDEKYVAAYVCMSNLYTAAGMHEDADRIEAIRVKMTGKCKGVVGMT